MNRDPRALALTLLLLAGCPHDFTRPPRRERAGDLQIDHLLLDRPSLDLQPTEVRAPDLDCPSPCVTTLTGGHGFADGALADARFRDPAFMVRDAGGGYLVADTMNHRIRRVAGGQVTTVAGGNTPGYLDGPAATAQLYEPIGVDVDTQGNIFVGDNGNDLIRQISKGLVGTLAGNGKYGFLDGAALGASFRGPGAVLLVAGTLLVADTYNNRIRRISGGQVVTYAGNGSAVAKDGPLLEASFEKPRDLALGPDGTLYFSDGNSRVRTISNGVVKTLAGGVEGYRDGAAAEAQFYLPRGIAVEPSGAVLVADTENHRIRRIAGGQVTTFAGTGDRGSADGPALRARFATPTDVLVDPSGAVLVSDTDNNRIRLIR